MLISGLVVILKPFVSVSVIPIHPDFAGFSNTSCGGGAFVGGTLGFPWFEKLKRNRILDSLWCVVLGYDHRMNLSICIHTPEKVVWYVWYVYMCIHIYIYVCIYVHMYIHTCSVCSALAGHCQLWFHHLSNCKVSGRASRALGGAGGPQLFI